MSILQLSAVVHRLNFRSPFGIAHGSRLFTDTIFVRASFMGQHGYGEAALPPYLGYDPVQLVQDYHRYFPETMDSGDAIRTAMSALSNPSLMLPKPLKCATDIAMYDLFGKMTGRSIRQIFGITGAREVLCSYTLGISTVQDMLKKLDEAGDFRLFKLKLGGDNDRERVEAFLEKSSIQFCVDANQAWKTVDEAVSWISWLADKGCLFVEQPLPVSMKDKFTELFQRSALPVILDESIQSVNDIIELQAVCHGVNVKLVKSGGLESAVAMVRQANKSGLKVLIGCMSESTCGAMAAAQLSPWADWVDLDGPRLIDNDPFEGAVYENGVLKLPDDSGTGARLKLRELFEYTDGE